MLALQLEAAWREIEASCLDSITGALHGAVCLKSLLCQRRAVGATAASRFDVVVGKTCLRRVLA